jgi:hypothetical protein
MLIKINLMQVGIVRIMLAEFAQPVLIHNAQKFYWRSSEL